MADVILQIRIPDAYVTKALDAFNKITNTHIGIEARGSSPNPVEDFDGKWDFPKPIAPKNIDETNKQFGERVLRELGKAVINMVILAEKNKNYRETVAAIPLPTSNIPDDILI